MSLAGIPGAGWLLVSLGDRGVGGEGQIKIKPDPLRSPRTDDCGGEGLLVMDQPQFKPIGKD
jgi:hypothetical protein